MFASMLYRSTQWRTVSIPTRRDSVGLRSIARPAHRNVDPTLPRFGTDCLPLRWRPLQEQTYSEYRLNNNAAFVPPKPKLFDKT
jgi:hypothetical protein